MPDTRDRPGNEIPALVLLDTPLARTDGAALWVDTLFVYSTGIAFTVQARFREDPGPDYVGLGTYIEPHTAPDLYLVAAFADGRVATNTVDFRFGPSDPDQLHLVSYRGGGSPHSSSAAYFLSPLPPSGPFSLVLALPRLGIGETRISLDGSTLAEAAGHVVTLWAG